MIKLRDVVFENRESAAKRREFVSELYLNNERRHSEDRAADLSLISDKYDLLDTLMDKVPRTVETFFISQRIYYELACSSFSGSIWRTRFALPPFRYRQHPVEAISPASSTDLYMRSTHFKKIAR